MQINENDDPSTWNDAKGYLERIDQIIRLMHEAKWRHNHAKRWDFLDSFYLELESQLSDRERKGDGDKEKGIEHFYSRAYKAMIEYITAVASKRPADPFPFMEAMTDLEILLRRIQNKKGLLMPKGQNPMRPML